ncbi:MAG: YqiA/YcfP family alpha/beta fold hydrolase [Bacteroidota bacterium]
MNKTIIYIGGYQSGGHKSSYFSNKLECDFVSFTPDYDNENPKDIRQKIIDSIDYATEKGHKVEVIGSSTGGMTALLLSAKYNLAMYLINPLISKEHFFDQNHPVGPSLKPLSEIILNQDYDNNNIKIFLGENDDLLNPEYTKKFAASKNIEVISFVGDHAGNESLDLIINCIKNN